MIDWDFWYGFSFGFVSMFLFTTALTIFVIYKCASFHDQWLDEHLQKRNKNE